MGLGPSGRLCAFALALAAVACSRSRSDAASRSRCLSRSPATEPAAPWADRRVRPSGAGLAEIEDGSISEQQALARSKRKRAGRPIVLTSVRERSLSDCGWRTGSGARSKRHEERRKGEEDGDHRPDIQCQSA